MLGGGGRWDPYIMQMGVGEGGGAGQMHNAEGGVAR